MRTEVDRAELVRALAAITKVVDTRNTIPLLSHVLLTAGGDALVIRGTDLDVEAVATVAANVEVVGQIAVPGRELADIAKRMVGETVKLDLDTASNGTVSLIVKAGRSRFKLPTLKGDSFPSIGTATFDANFSTDLSALLGRVAFAGGPNSKHAMLDGVYLHAVDGRLRAAATNAYRLAYADGEPCAGFDGIIIPTRLVGLLPSGVVNVAVSRNIVRVTSGSGDSGALTITGKLIEDTYPNYAALLPADNVVTLTADRRQLREAVNRVAVIADEDLGRGIKFAANDNVAALSIRSQSEAVDSVEVDYSGEPVWSGFNCADLNEMLNRVPGERVTVQMGGKRGAVFTGDPGFLGIVMYFNLGAAA